MSRWLILFAMLAAAWETPTAQAQIQSPYDPLSPEAAPLLPIGPANIPQLAAAPSTNTNSTTTSDAGTPVAAAAPGYVRLNAPLYPSPKPNVPVWTGSTLITNQAFAPHEMLYPHTYRAMYPPFYHRVRGCYHWTPFGYRSHENWDLLGTTVEVQYRSHWPLLGPHKPVLSSWGGPWK